MHIRDLLVIGAYLFSLHPRQCLLLSDRVGQLNVRFVSNSAVAAALPVPLLWVPERYGSEGTKRQTLSTRT